MAHNLQPHGSQNSFLEQLHEHASTAPRAEAVEKSAFALRKSNSVEAAEKPAFAPPMYYFEAAEQSAFASRMSNSAEEAAEKSAFASSTRSAKAAKQSAFAPPRRNGSNGYSFADETGKQRHAFTAAPGPAVNAPPTIRRRDPSEYISEPGRVPRLYDYLPDFEANLKAQHGRIDFKSLAATMKAIVDEQERVLEGVKSILKTPVARRKSHFIRSDEEEERI
ncbi:hypothetical protein HBI56_222900 [Parastagonospora nodorum]|nr:hypothetical protein HBH52_064490 [Parastagonospora nodorum]KAH4216254.1 hypothetical protein HBI06_234410 [Parastagonospora nodorum]KAH4226346.1 hypothetical protein HBI05_220590 [Parastagonospora nodorum]KAH5029066.1 hypothetical protein HBI74_103880 [Parastagonospora nodorum]KAH6148842.1 hypothetical protein HBI68_189430 [Parastagonospora nodorum]